MAYSRAVLDVPSVSFRGPSESCDSSAENGAPLRVPESSADPATVSAQTPALPELSAEALHRAALGAFREGNRARLEFIRALRALAESRLYFTLGFPSIVAYSMRFFGYRRSETYEALRVAACLERLPRSNTAFSTGQVSWGAMKQITRVAAPASEGEWLAFAAGRSVGDVRAEVEHAVEAGIDRPRERRFGLPDLKVRVVLEMTRSEHEVLRAALERVGAAIREPLGGRSVALKDALLALAERLLASGADADLSGTSPGAEPPRTILYHVCPECRRGGMETAEGRVELAAEVIERIEGCARREEISPDDERPVPGSASTGGGPTADPGSESARADDALPVSESARADGGSLDAVPPAGPVEARAPIDRPNPASLRRRVLLRDGERCANPSCLHRAKHCHHIIHRSRGGRTELWNETAVCRRCHALIHAGLLRVEGDPAQGLVWRATGEGIGGDLVESARADSAPTRER